MAVKSFTIDRIALLDDESVGVVLNSKADAENCLQKNPRARVLHEENGDYVLIYSVNEIDLTRAIKRL